MTMIWVKPGNALRLGLGLVVALVAIGCGGGGAPPPPTVSVTVTPSTASVLFGGTQQFTATVTGNSNTAVTWSVKGGGKISSTGLYTAPSAMLPSPTSPQSVLVSGGATSSGNIIAVSQLPTVTNPVTITATSQADTTKSASASVTIKALSFIAAGLGTSGDGTAFTLHQGASDQLFLVGTGFLPGTTYAITGPNDITLTQPTTSNGGFCHTKDVPPLPCATVPIMVNSNAQLGPRNIMVTNPAGEMTVFVGGLVIVP